MTKQLPRILHIFPSFFVGGTEMKASLIINGSINKYHHTIVVLGGAMQAEILFVKSENIVIEDLRAKMPPSALAKILFSRRLIKERAPDLVISYGWGASDAVIGKMLFLKTPHIHFEEGFHDETPAKQKLIRRIIRIVAFRFATFLCLPSEFLCSVAKSSWFMPKHKIRFIPNGIDLQTFKVIKEHAPNNNSVVILILASLNPIKNHSRLFRVFATASSTVNLSLIVAGAGEGRAALESYALELGIRDKVTMAGYISDPHIIFPTADIFCLSSDSEQMPMTIIEAMAASLPVVATDVGDIKLMVSPENRPYIVDVNDEAVFAEKLITMAQNSLLRNKIGKANHDKCMLCYDRQTMIEKMVALYEEAIAQSSR